MTAEDAGGLPRFVVREVEEHLRCGLLEHGCVRVAEVFEAFVAMKMAQVQMMGALERAMAPGAEGAEGDDAADGEADDAAGLKAARANAKSESKP